MVLSDCLLKLALRSLSLLYRLLWKPVQQTRQ